MDYALTAWSMGLVLVGTGLTIVVFVASDLVEDIREARRKARLDRLMGRQRGGSDRAYPVDAQGD